MHRSVRLSYIYLSLRVVASVQAQELADTHLTNVFSSYIETINSSYFQPVCRFNGKAKLDLSSALQLDGCFIGSIGVLRHFFRATRIYSTTTVKRCRTAIDSKVQNILRESSRNKQT